MIADKPRSRPFKAGNSPKKNGKPGKTTFNSNLSTNYELMLRLYLVNKELKMTKDGLHHPRLTEDARMEQIKPASTSVWNNIIQAITKANQLINIFSHPKMEVLTK